MPLRTLHLLQLCLFFVGLLLVTGCSSSFKVLDTWTSEEFENLNSRKILVVCRTDNTEYRSQIEKDIVRKLESQGVDAAMSLTMLPFLKPPESKEDEHKIKKLLLEEGYDGLVLAAVKNTIKSIKAGTDYSIEDGNLPGEDALSITYIIEANVYDLSRQDGEELVGVNLVGITDPSSVAKLSNSYSKLISKQFKKGM